MKEIITRRIRRVPGLGPVMLGFVLLACPLAASAQDDTEEAGDTSNLTPYQTALLNYKNGHYEVAHDAIETAVKTAPNDPKTVILEARILTELRDFDDAKKALESLNGNKALTPALGVEWTMAFGDMCLRQRDFDGATKFYESLQKPNDPDVTLKIIYARIGAGDLVTAAKLASKLKPLDQDHPSYYFAEAALAQATGKADEVDQDIETSRTIYGITMTNRYLKTFFEVFSNADKNSGGAPASTPPAPTNAPPANPQ
ncbi:MAG: hypothetical protein LV479_03940 [Methylacidiphilales bacterium]|nr:hypothetical protein [Candidatus Methylacidiphilales bacterium]